MNNATIHLVVGVTFCAVAAAYLIGGVVYTSWNFAHRVGMPALIALYAFEVRRRILKERQL